MERVIKKYGVEGAVRFSNLTVKKRNDTYSANLITTKNRSFFPSDGVVLERSQKAFPGVKISDTDLLPHNNHMQVRNSTETKRVLEDLYDGVLYDMFFKLTP